MCGTVNDILSFPAECPLSPSLLLSKPRESSVLNLNSHAGYTPDRPILALSREACKSKEESQAYLKE